VKFANQGRFRPFARLKLAAGKFPQARQRLALRPLRDQNAIVGIDQSAGDDQGEFDASHMLFADTSGEAGPRGPQSSFDKDSLTLLGPQFRDRNKPNLIPSR
jgi:hypothetical protein